VRNRIRVKREELAMRRDMLAEAHKLLGDQRDDASEADMLLHAERYDGLYLYPRIMLTSQQ
jgi:predicted metal-dependent hydrolase